MAPDAAELAIERAHLSLADRDIAQGEQRIRDQLARVARCRERGNDVARAEHLLEVLEETLREWQTHRDLIAARIAYLEQRSNP